VTGRDVPDGDMPNLPWPTHRRGEPVTGDPSLAGLLAWAEFPAGSEPELKPVAEVLAALTAGPSDDELAGEAAALAAYRNRGSVPRAATRARRRRRRPLFPFPSVRVAAAVAGAAAVLSVGAFATAAYTQVLPAPVQRLAHAIIGAPGAGGGPATGPSPAGSGATGRDATGPGGTGPAGGTPTGRAAVPHVARHRPAHTTGLRRAEHRAHAIRLRDADADKEQGEAEHAPHQRQRERGRQWERQREREQERRQHADPAAMTRRSQLRGRGAALCRFPPRAPARHLPG
jgi:hypothetical protein